MMNITQRVQAHKHGIHFGLDHQDVADNIKMQVDYFRGLDYEDIKEMKDQSQDNVSQSGSNKKKNVKKDLPAQLTKLYSEIEKDIKATRQDGSN